MHGRSQNELCEIDIYHKLSFVLLHLNLNLDVAFIRSLTVNSGSTAYVRVLGEFIHKCGVWEV